MIQLVVGRWEHVRKYGPTFVRLSCLDLVHPRDFREALESFQGKKGYFYWTNNPYVLNHFLPENILIVNRNESYFMDTHRKWNDWKDELSPGEFWSIFGEDK